MRSVIVLESLGDLFVERGVPEYIRPDNDSEFIAQLMPERLGRAGAKALYIEPGSSWENRHWRAFMCS